MMDLGDLEDKIIFGIGVVLALVWIFAITKGWI